jgi:hypothetical protein
MLQLLGIILASCAIGFGGGWMVNDWRNGEEIARLESRSSFAESANQQCETDIADVRKGLAEMINAATDRAKKAETAMLSAQGQAAKHAATAKAIRDAPMRRDESTCDAVFREQMEYVQKRRDS